MIWCERGGALLINGLYVKSAVQQGVLADPNETGDLRGAVVNLTHGWAPEPSIDRTRIVEDASEQVGSLLAGATRELFDANPRFFHAGWISNLAAASPAVADLVVTAAAEATLHYGWATKS